MVEDDHILSKSLCLALTKFNGIPQAAHTQLGFICITCLQRPKKRWKFRTNKVIFSWTHRSEYTFLACSHFVLVWLILEHICPTSHIPSCSHPSPLVAALAFFSALSLSLPGSPAEIRHCFAWCSAVDLRESGEHPSPIRPLLRSLSLSEFFFFNFSKILGCIASITPAAVLQKNTLGTEE